MIMMKNVKFVTVYSSTIKAIRRDFGWSGRGWQNATLIYSWVWGYNGKNEGTGFAKKSLRQIQNEITRDLTIEEPGKTLRMLISRGYIEVVTGMYTDREGRQNKVKSYRCTSYKHGSNEAEQEKAAVAQATCDSSEEEVIVVDSEKEVLHHRYNERMLRRIHIEDDGVVSLGSTRISDKNGEYFLDEYTRTYDDGSVIVKMGATIPMRPSKTAEWDDEKDTWKEN